MASEAEQAIKRITRCGDDYYGILGVSKGAGDDDIKKAYRKLALRLHPDKCQEKGAEEAFKRVGESFSVLSDKEKRRIYDQCGVDGLRGSSGGGAGGINPEDIFQAFFGGQGGFPGGGFPGGATFVQTGGRGNFQTFSFSTGGPGMGGVHFQSGSPFGRAGQGGMQARTNRQQREEPEEEREAEEVPQWLKSLQLFASALGPLLPIVIMGMMGLAMVMMSRIIQFFIQRAFIILPIMYLTEGRVKLILLSTLGLFAVLGIM